MRYRQSIQIAEAENSLGWVKSRVSGYHQRSLSELFASILAAQAKHQECLQGAYRMLPPPHQATDHSLPIWQILYAPLHG
ncbi:Uncharacterised protein [Vibrio cholerae]|nr:Uncharacterised protein [Vibrio cholerae]